ncbi:MAG: hypothetical protein TREMPRED_004020 [Tremellales sp. Tagirdzhanova-0007]|nr:MAG: hypothetical protein TREMPRED_004020 [Tremellales sp. Tagirdzhanova-0007]
MSQSPSNDREPLLPTSSTPSSPSTPETVPKGAAQYVPELDMVPTTRDKLSLFLIFAGVAMFLPLTWYMVFSGDVSAMGWFAVHPPLQSLAITAFLMGITPLQPSPPNSKVRQTRLNTHQSAMLGLVLPAFAVGSAAMWWNKHLHGADHFTTWHGRFGLATIVWVMIQVMIGAATVWFGGKAFGGQENAKKVYKYHRLSGYLLVLLALVTAHLAGAHSTWALGRPGMKDVRVAAFWVGLPLIGLGLVTRSRPSKMKLV